MITKGTYRHFKGREYEVIGFAKHSETLEDLVIYTPLYETKDFPKDMLWARPLKNFTEEIVRDGKTLSRFTLLKEK